MIEQRGDSVVIQGRALLGEVYRSVLNHIAHRRVNGTPSDDLRQLAKMLYRAYMSSQRHEFDSAADTPTDWNSQQSRADWVSTAEAADILQVSQRSVQRLAKAPGGLEAIRVGRTYMIRAAPLLALAQQRKQAS
jgi:excisionase family DNA binding protein